jgi:predicted amidohydrolase YtcJ
MTRTPRRGVSRLLPVVGLTLVMLACGPEPAPQLIVVGKVWTGDPAAPYAEAVGVSDQAILAVGDSTSLLALAGPATEVVRGAMIVPGFMDDHTHFFQGGFQLTRVDLRELRTPAEFIRRIAEQAERLPKGEWILGGDWDHEYWLEAGTPLPTREWIDSVTPDHPVLVNRYDSHMALANSLALRLAGVTAATPDVAGGEVVRDARGEPTGVLRDAAMGLVGRVVPEPSPEQMDSALARAMAHAASRGVTAVSHVSATWPEVAALERAHTRGDLTLRASVYIQLPDWRNAAESLRVNGPGDDWLRVAGVKGMVDGSLGSTTAWFFRPYDDAPRTTGLTVTPMDSIRTWVAAADSAGLQVVVHAIGDRANAELLDAFEAAAAANGPRDRRFRVEHAQHLRPEEIARFGGAGRRSGSGRSGSAPLTPSGPCSTAGPAWCSAPTGPWRRSTRCSASTLPSPAAPSTASTPGGGYRRRRSRSRRRSGRTPWRTRTACSSTTSPGPWPPAGTPTWWCWIAT